MTSYQALGIRPVINANATLTRLGGSLMPPEVVAAMAEAARSFVDLDELQRKVGERIAELTRNEAAYVSSGAAAGLVLATAACVAGTDPDAVHQLPSLDGLKCEIIVQKLHRNGYDHAVRQVGVDLIEIGNSTATTRSDLLTALSEKTAGIFWFQGAMNRPGELPLEEVIEVAKAHGIPVVVDAAAQLPPVSNLWGFTHMGADLALFSGGKDLRGPQATGLILGRRTLIECCRVHGNPNHAIGRPMKVGKEEMFGLLAAVERYVKLDHQARANECERIVTMWNETLSDIDGVVAKRDFPNEAGQPLPRSLVLVDSETAGITHDRIIDELAHGEPAISVAPAGPGGLYLNPMTLEPGEAETVRDRLLEILSSKVVPR
ncbi:MAG: aminotransferase class V-fold PLP-dependent enzyme [Trueperaceae bacterium]|nr:MAG: aminotransferase class V-fold PLP-dependent enzyme [Trueperaceae bacterium]